MVCARFVDVVVFVERVSGYVACLSGREGVCCARGSLCPRKGWDRRGRKVFGNVEFFEGGVYLGWGCGCAEFPRRVPRAGGRRRRRLPARRGAGNPSPCPHEILIRPSGRAGRERAKAGRCPWCCCVSPNGGITAQAGAGLGGEETSPPTCLRG